MTGTTIHEILKILFIAVPNVSYIRCVIIAENHFFEWHYHMPGISVNFFVYSRLIQGLNANISYFIPKDLYARIASEILEVDSYKQAMAIVTAGAMKRRDEESAFFDFGVEQTCQNRITNFKATKVKLITELKDLVGQGTFGYKDKSIQFRF